MAKVSVQNLNVSYDDYHALKDVTLEVMANEILGVIGPANSGKSSLLRAINRLSEIDYAKVSGTIMLDDVSVDMMDKNILRKRIGLIFATPVVLPGSIHKNISYGPKLHRRFDKKELDNLVEHALKAANLWD
jgi:phosphate transport system ATP-binding protein